MKKVTSKSFLERLAKIEKIPSTVADSIPFRGVLKNGIIETKPGVYTRTFRLNDVNFLNSSAEEEQSICDVFQKFINGIDQEALFEFTIFNHLVDKKTTLQQVRMLPRKDGLNKYRSEMNRIMVGTMKEGEESIIREKYFTVSVTSVNEEHAIQKLDKIGIQVQNALRNICGELKALNGFERLELLHRIYNQGDNYKLTSNLFTIDDEFDFDTLEKKGYSVKDVIGPVSFDFSPVNRFMVGDMYATTYYLDHVPEKLTTEFLTGISELQCQMLISTTTNRMTAEKANKTIKNKLAGIDAKAADVNKAHLKEGYMGELPPELQNAQESVRNIMQDITTHDQSLFTTTLTVTLFAPTLQRLEEGIALIRSVSNGKNAPLKRIRHQQEFAFNMCLPLCRNDLYTDIMLTTESECAFIPFASRELNMPNSIFYGRNLNTGGIMMYDRRAGDNYNGLIFGGPGSGKSFIAKFEMISVLLRYTDAQVIVIDPQEEYSELAKAVNGQEIRVVAGGKGKVHLNPMDINLEDSDEDSDPVATKVDYLISMINMMRGDDEKLNASEKNVLDRAINDVYAPYIDLLVNEGKRYDASRCPTLKDLYQKLVIMGREDEVAQYLADNIRIYTNGSFAAFADRTNFETNSRFIAYNIKNLGSGMQNFGVYVCLSDIINHIIQNNKKGLFTYLYIDEMHIPMQSTDAKKLLTRIWKTVRKWGCAPTGILQNTNDLLLDDTADGIFKNTQFMLMMKSSRDDRDNLQANIDGLSDSLIEFIGSKATPGTGLLFNGRFTLPFKLSVPENSELFKLINTKPQALRKGA